jgi:hypothetical protein
MTRMQIPGGPERRSVKPGEATAFLPGSYSGQDDPNIPGDADDQTANIGRLGRAAEPAADDRSKQAGRGALASEGGVGGSGKVAVRRASGDATKLQATIKSLTGQS